MGTRRRPTCWGSTAATSPLHRSYRPGRRSTSSSCPTTPTRGRASLCATRSSKQVNGSLLHSQAELGNLKQFIINACFYLSSAPLHHQQYVTLADVSLDEESTDVNKQAVAPTTHSPKSKLNTGSLTC